MESTIITSLIAAINSIIIAVITKQTNKKVNNFKEHILDNDKTYLTDFLSDIENGMKKTDIQLKRAYEIYERYIKNGGNSYVKDTWEEAKKRGLLKKGGN